MICALLTKQTNKAWIEVERTEASDEASNPDFKKHFQITFAYENNQQCMFRMISSVGGKEKVVGECITSYGAIMGARGSIFAGFLEKKDE